MAAAAIFSSEAAPANPFLAALAARDADRAVEVWPENWLVFLIFRRLATQWHIGMAGPTGLRYESLYPLLDRSTTTTEEWDEMFDDIRSMEDAVLEQEQQKASKS